MMKKLILNCFHLHGSSNKFPFLFLSFPMFHGPCLNSRWAVTYQTMWQMSRTLLIIFKLNELSSREKTVLPFGTLGHIFFFLHRAEQYHWQQLYYHQYHETHVSLNLFHVWFTKHIVSPQRHILDHNPVYSASPLNFVWTVFCLLPPKPNTYKFSNALSLH